MNAFDNWLKSMADNSKTCDTVITESSKKIKRHRLGKLSEDEQGMIKYRRLLDKWITKEQDDDYIKTDDDENENLRTPGEISYTLKKFDNLTFTDINYYTISLDSVAITPEELRHDGEKSLYSIFTDDEIWNDHIECKINSHSSSSIGAIIHQMLQEKNSEEDSGIKKAGSFLGKLFDVMIQYDVGAFDKFIKEYEIEIVNEKSGTLRIPNNTIDTLFDIILTPMDD